MARSSKRTKKSGGRRRSSPVQRPYRYISYNPQTGIFTITVLGHVRTAPSDALALWTREQMFQEYASERDCSVCHKPFKPTLFLDQTICSDVCQSLQAAVRTRTRRREIQYVERYLYRREGTWIAEPHDAHLGVRLKATFQTEEEARDYIKTVTNSTRPWRIRKCKSCGDKYDWYEDGLHHRATKCFACGGARYKERSEGPRRKEAITSTCSSCGAEITSYLGYPPSYCDECVRSAASKPEQGLSSSVSTG